MKLWIVTLLFSLSFLSWAENQAQFAKDKTTMLTQVSQVISMMQMNKTCIEAAKDYKSLDNCQKVAKNEKTKISQ